MTILTRKEREQLVLDLYYNQGKTYRDISKEARISPRDIRNILNKVIEEKRTEGLKEEEGIIIINSKNHNQENERHLSISAQAYKLFSERKTPLEVAIALNLKESEATKFYKEYWKLKQLHNLNLVYEELGDEGIGDFLKLYKISKKEDISKEQVIHLLQLSDEDNASGLSQLQKRRKWLVDNIHEFDLQIERSKKHLQSANDEIASAKALLNSYHTLCERKREEAANLNNEISRLEAVISRFKNNNEELFLLKSGNIDAGHAIT